MTLYHKLKLHYALYLLKHHKLKFVDIWYYNHQLQKECIMTLMSHIDIDRYFSDLTTGVNEKKYTLTYIHLGENMI